MKAARYAIIAVLVLAASLGGWLYVLLYVPVGGGRQTIRFTVEEGAATRDVAAALKAHGLIRSASAFRLAAAWGDGWRRAIAGDYALRRDINTVEILRTIQSGSVISEWVTVPEGLCLRQVAELVEAKGLGSQDEFLSVVDSPGDFNITFPRPERGLEGYLFPDTYKVARHPGASGDLVGMMLARFDEVVWQDVLKGRHPAEVGRGNPGSAADSPISSLHELITLASMVEGEAKLDADRPIVAAVLTNRLKLDMKLECDATVQYALGAGRKERLTYDDLKLPSPYNTYLHPGLPPGPINSPGRASIEAALHPAVVPYLFYVARPDGSHIFSRTYAEHLRAIARARAERRAQESQ